MEMLKLDLQTITNAVKQFSILVLSKIVGYLSELKAILL